jgi:hypothetical protein
VFCGQNTTTKSEIRVHHPRPAARPVVGAAAVLWCRPEFFAWRYSESGEFIDFSGGRNIIFRDEFVASGSETGPIVLGGIRFAGNTFSGGFEIRYHSADAALGAEFAHLSPNARIDLGGWTYQMTVGYRFGR